MYFYFQHLVGIPKLYWSGTEGDYNMMVMELLGPNLEELFDTLGRKLSLKTTLMLADQMVTHHILQFSRIEYIHSKYFIHRDIKADNFLIGRGSKIGIIYLIDFGLAKRYKDPKTGLHIPYKSNKALTGTARYASISTHMGIEQSRRDDIEATIYVLLYFLRGSLPWQGINAKNKDEKYKKIMETKMATSMESLCKGLPSKYLIQRIGEFQELLKHARSLKFEEEPNFSFIKKQLKTIFEAKSYKYDLTFDWTADLTPKKTGSLSHLVAYQRQFHDKEENKAIAQTPLLNHSSPYEQNSLAVNYSTRNDKSPKKQINHSVEISTLSKAQTPLQIPVQVTVQTPAQSPIVEQNNTEKKQPKKCGCRIL